MMMRGFLVAMAAFPLVACGGGSSFASNEGQPVQATGTDGARSFAARDFNRVSLRGPDNVEVTTGGEFGIRAEGDAETLDRLEIRLDGDRLLIGRKDQSGGNWRPGGGSARILVSMPAIRQANLAGSGDFTINRVQGDFDGNLAGSGDFTIGVLEGGSTELSLAGSGTFAASGQVDRLKVSIAGSGDIDAGGLVAGAASVSVAGSGDVRARVNGDASVSIMGSGNVDLGPDSRCSISKVGSGKVTCGVSD